MSFHFASITYIPYLSVCLFVLGEMKLPKGDEILINTDTILDESDDSSMPVSAKGQHRTPEN